MTLYPVQVTRVGVSRYLVRIEVDRSSKTHEFEFAVSGDDIRVVESPPAFEEWIGHNGGAVRNLLAAVLAFDRSQGTVVEGDAPVGNSGDDVRR